MAVISYVTGEEGRATGMAERVQVSRVKRATTSPMAAVPTGDPFAALSAPRATPRRVRSRGYDLHAVNASPLAATGAGDDGFSVEDYLAPMPLCEKRTRSDAKPVAVAECGARADGRFDEQHWSTPAVDAAGVLPYEVGTMDLPSSLGDSPQRARPASGANVAEVTRTFADSSAAAGSRADALTAPGDSAAGDFTGACRTVDPSVVQHRDIAEKLRDVLTDNRYVHPAYNPGSAGIAWLLPITARRLGAKSPFAESPPQSRRWPTSGLFRRSA